MRLHESKKSFILLITSPWLKPIIKELKSDYKIIKIDIRAALPFSRRNKQAEPSNRTSSALEWTYLPGFNGKLSFLFNHTICSRFINVIDKLYHETGDWPYVITDYPKYFKYLKKVRPFKLIYYNQDNNDTYSSSGRCIESHNEAKLIGLADIVLCASKYQFEHFKLRYPVLLDSFHHFPHGVNESTINPQPSQHPAIKSVATIGSLTARYDWDLIYDVIKKLPDVKFTFVGNVSRNNFPGVKGDWYSTLSAVLSLPNVKLIPQLNEQESASYYWNSSLNWLPYSADLPFNRACCPLKLFTGLASGRQVISADVPECRLYPELVNIYRNADEAMALIINGIENGDTPESRQRRYAQIEFARKNTWADRAKKLVEILELNSAAAGDMKVS